MNLAYRYPLIYWNTANLIVDSSGLDGDEEEDEEEDSKEKEKVNRAEKTVNYAKVGRAIGNFQSLGIKVVPPDINESKFTFAPDEEHNAIIYGLRGITGLSTEASREIIKYRPYHNVQDLLSLVKLKKPAIINLIKCGAFDQCENRPRAEILHDYIDSIADKKAVVNLRNMNMLINYELIPDDQAFYAQLFLLNKELKNQKYIPTEGMISFIENCDRLDFDDLMDDDGSINAAKWDKVYKKIMKEMAAYLKENQEAVLEQLNQCLFNEAAEKYMIGNESKWEMESVCYYYGKHELDYSNESFDDFSSLSPEPAVEKSFFGRDGRIIPIYQIFRIGGTVLGKNKLKNSITLLTQTGVVNVKIYKELFSHFDKQISAIGEEGKKKIIERSWFKRGTLLSISGIRRGDDFVLRSRKNSPFPAIAKITGIKDGFLEYQFERAKGTEEEEMEDEIDDRIV